MPAVWNNLWRKALGGLLRVLCFRGSTRALVNSCGLADLSFGQVQGYLTVVGSQMLAGEACSSTV
jgi:hypothetical protein